jgi:UDP-N-acetylmuramoylalanine--D-glutamate ligase
MAEHGISPHIFAITNLLEDHLDRYANVDAYHEAKGAVLDHQKEDDWAILPSRRFDRERLEPRTRGRVAYFEAAGEPLPGGAQGVSCSGGVLRARWNGSEVELVRVDALPMKAEHYLSNIAAAACVALAAGAEPESLRDPLRSLRPLKDRQEIVATLDEILYVNDTTATMPAAAAASIRSYSGRDLVVIAGGASKWLDPTPLAVAASALARHVVLLDGPATAGIERALHHQGFSAISAPYDSMASAVIAAESLACPGSIVLLAPGASSFGMFQNEFDRGRKFREAVLDGAEASSPQRGQAVPPPSSAND